VTDDERFEELRRAASRNLTRIASGDVRREQEALRASAAQRREQLKADRRELKRLENKKLKALREERDGLQAYMDELLLRTDPNPLGLVEGTSDAMYQGILEEVDSALNGCNKEIVDTMTRVEILKRTTNGR
jgi:hypothetical protein